MTRSILEAVASRAPAIGVGAVLILVSVLALPAWRGAGPTGLLEASQPAARGAQQIAAWLVEADVTLRPNLGYMLDIRLTRDVGVLSPNQVRPIVIIKMDGMPEIEPPLELVAAGDYRAEGVLPMAGRWRFSVGFEDDFLDLLVDVPSIPVGEPT